MVAKTAGSLIGLSITLSLANEIAKESLKLSKVKEKEYKLPKKIRKEIEI